MSINNKKTVVLSRFLCYLTIINAKLGDDERHWGSLGTGPLIPF